MDYLIFTTSKNMAKIKTPFFYEFHIIKNSVSYLLIIPGNFI